MNDKSDKADSDDERDDSDENAPETPVEEQPEEAAAANDEASEASSEESTEASPEEEAGPVAGERLAAARREQQISLDEVAKELHLDERKVRALEKNQFESLGAPVFAKGHLRKYAMLVGISVEEAIAEYESLNQAADEPPVVGIHAREPRDFAAGPWVALIAVVLLLVAIYWWFFVRQPANTVPEPAAEPAAAVSAVVEEAPEDEVGTVESVADDVADDAPVAADAETVEPATIVETAATVDGRSTLTVRFSGDCWTEISDATGERLFFGLGREGRTAELVGSLPFSATLGAADNVTLVLDGEPYAIPASARRGDTARLTIVSR